MSEKNYARQYPEESALTREMITKFNEVYTGENGSWVEVELTLGYEETVTLQFGSPEEVREFRDRIDNYLASRGKFNNPGASPSINEPPSGYGDNPE